MSILRFAFLATLLASSTFAQPLTSAINSNEGGQLNLANPGKTGATTSQWTLFNMTGPYNNGLAFWRYYADGTNAGPSVFLHDSGNVGIGTTNPGIKLSVAGGGGYSGVQIGTEAGGAYLRWSREGRTSDANKLNIYDQDGAATIATFQSGGNVGIGITNPQHKLAVNGTIKAKEVIVETTGWSDYVFADGYRLAPLSEIEAHIAEKKHLPGLPSAAEVAEKGVNVSQVQAALLAKVEELTLHLISQEKSLRELKAENETLKTRMATYEQR